MKVKVTPNHFKQVPTKHKLFKGSESGAIYLKISETELINISPLPSGALFDNFNLNATCVEPFYGKVELCEE